MQTGTGKSNESVYEEREMTEEEKLKHLQELRETFERDLKDLDKETKRIAIQCFLLLCMCMYLAFSIGTDQGRTEIRDSYNTKYRCVESRLVQATPECVVFVLKEVSE